MKWYKPLMNGEWSDSGDGVSKQVTIPFAVFGNCSIAHSKWTTYRADAQLSLFYRLQYNMNFFITNVEYRLLILRSTFYLVFEKYYSISDRFSTIFNLTFYRVFMSNLFFFLGTVFVFNVYSQVSHPLNSRIVALLLACDVFFF